MGCVRPPGGEQGVGASLDADPHSLPPGGRRSVHGPPAALVAPGARGRRVPSAVLVRPFPTLPFLSLRCETCGAVGKGSVCPLLHRRVSTRRHSGSGLRPGPARVGGGCV